MDLSLTSVEVSQYIFLSSYLFSIFLVLYLNSLLRKIDNIHPEICRKFPHILSGLLIMNAATVLERSYFLLLLLLLFVGANYTYLHKKRFPALYAITRKSFGTVLYPFTLLILALFLLPENLDVFLYATGMMVVVDGLTGLIGSLYGTKIPKYDKTFLGSSVFFVLGSLLGLFVGLPLFESVVFAFIIAVHEFFVRWGIDNFTIPVIATILFLMFS